MNIQDLYWVERQSEGRYSDRVAIQANAVLNAGFHLLGSQNIQAFRVNSAQYHHYREIEKERVDKIVADSINTQAIFADDAVIAYAQITSRVQLSSEEVKTLDKLMEGIEMLPLRRK